MSQGKQIVFKKKYLLFLVSIAFFIGFCCGVDLILGSQISTRCRGGQKKERKKEKSRERERGRMEGRKERKKIREGKGREEGECPLWLSGLRTRLVAMKMWV